MKVSELLPLLNLGKTQMVKLCNAPGGETVAVLDKPFGKANRKHDRYMDAEVVLIGTSNSYITISIKRKDW